MVDVSDIFSCTRCGYCCRGETTVSLDGADQVRMITSLDMRERDVREQYWRISGNSVQMKIVDGYCIFYDDGCSVHNGRPWRCAQWPLHPSILDDENNFLILLPFTQKENALLFEKRLREALMKDSCLISKKIKFDFKITEFDKKESEVAFIQRTVAS